MLPSISNFRTGTNSHVPSADRDEPHGHPHLFSRTVDDEGPELSKMKDTNAYLSVIFPYQQWLLSMHGVTATIGAKENVSPVSVCAPFCPPDAPSSIPSVGSIVTTAASAMKDSLLGSEHAQRTDTHGVRGEGMPRSTRNSAGSFSPNSTILIVSSAILATRHHTHPLRHEIFGLGVYRP